MPTIYFTNNPSKSYTFAPLKPLQQEVKAAYFATRKSKNKYKTKVTDHKTTKGQTIGKIAKQYGVKSKAVKRTKKTKYLQIGEIVQVTVKEKIGKKVSFKKIESAAVAEEVYIVVETLHLEEEHLHIKILQAEENVLAEVDKPITVQLDGSNVDTICINVGNYLKEKDITNKKDFENWAIAKVKLQPKKEEEQKKWKEGLACITTNTAKLYLSVDGHTDNSIPNFKATYMLYKGTINKVSKIKNHFLNEEKSYFELRQNKVIDIYHNGEISKVDLKDAKKVSYIYHDKGGNKYDLGNVSVIKIKEWKKKNVITKNDCFLVKMEDLQSFKKENIKFGYQFSSTTRRYINPESMAGFIGAMIDVGYVDFTSTGFSNKDGNPGVSNSHINGKAGDLLYLNTKLTNKTTLLEDKNFDYDRMVKFVNALYKFGWGKTKSILSEKFNRVIGQKEIINPKTKNKEKIDVIKETLLPHTIHYKKKLKNGKFVRHHHHIHLNGLKPNYK